jgi:hypothetical protein
MISFFWMPSPMDPSSPEIEVFATPDAKLQDIWLYHFGPRDESLRTRLWGVPLTPDDPDHGSPDVAGAPVPRAIPLAWDETAETVDRRYGGLIKVTVDVEDGTCPKSGRQTSQRQTLMKRPAAAGATADLDAEAVEAVAEREVKISFQSMPLPTDPPGVQRWTAVPKEYFVEPAATMSEIWLAYYGVSDGSDHLWVVPQTADDPDYAAPNIEGAPAPGAIPLAWDDTAERVERLYGGLVMHTVSVDPEERVCPMDPDLVLLETARRQARAPSQPT